MKRNGIRPSEPVDHKGYSFNENSKEYNDALISNDKWTGRIIQKLKDLKLYDKTLVYVTADHGFNEGATGHPSAPRVFLGTTDPKVLRHGDRADIAPTILDRFGLHLKQLRGAEVTATRPAEKDPPWPAIRWSARAKNRRSHRPRVDGER